MASNPQQEPRGPRPPNQAGRGQGPSHGPRSHSHHRPKPGGWQPGPNEEGNKGKNQGGQGGNQNNSKPQPQTLPDFSKAKSGMECPVCMDMMKAPIYMCEGGHSFCDKCTLSFTPPICPLCRAKMTLLRNFSLESILNQVSVLCPNSMFGCDHRCLEDELPSHYQSCSFKQTFCPMARIRNEVKCSWHGMQDELFNHMKDAHKNNVTLEFGRQILFQNFSVAKADADLQVMRFQRNLFLYHVRIEPSEGLAYWAVQLVGSAEAASEWKYELHVYDAAQPMKKVLITEPCTGDGEDVPALFASGRCAALPLKLVSHFVRNNRFTFKVFVYNTKAPDTSDLKPLMDALPNMPKKNMYQKNKK